MNESSQLQVLYELEGNLEKLIFQALERDMANEYGWEVQDGIQMYKLYLSKTMTHDTCFSNEFLTNESVIQAFFGKKNESPKYFSLSSHLDLKRLASVCLKSFVLTTPYVNKRARYIIKYFDYRLPEEIFLNKRDEDAWLELSGDKYDKEHTLHYLLRWESGGGGGGMENKRKYKCQFGVIGLIAPSRALEYQPLNTESKFILDHLWDIPRSYNRHLMPAVLELMIYFTSPLRQRRKFFNSKKQALLKELLKECDGRSLNGIFEDPKNAWQSLIKVFLQYNELERAMENEEDGGPQEQTTLSSTLSKSPEFPSGLIILAHIGPKQAAVMKRKPFRYDSQLFSTLTILGGGRHIFEWAKSWVLIVSPGGRLYRPKDELEELLIGQHREQREGLERPLNPSSGMTSHWNWTDNSKVLERAGQALNVNSTLDRLDGNNRDIDRGFVPGNRQSKLEKEAKRVLGHVDDFPDLNDDDEMDQNDEDEDDDHQLGAGSVNSNDEWFQPCGCLSCSESIKFKDNMNAYGPPKLYSSQMDLHEALEWVGWLSPTLKKVLSLCCSLSCSSVDIESTTHTVNEDLHGKRTMGISSGYQGGPSSAVQKPILWCHLDCVLEDKESYCQPETEVELNSHNGDDGGMEEDLKQSLQWALTKLSAEGDKAYFLRSNSGENNVELSTTMQQPNFEGLGTRNFCGSLPMLYNTYLKYLRERQNRALAIKCVLLTPLFQKALMPVFEEHCKFFMEWITQDPSRVGNLIPKPLKVRRAIKNIYLNTQLEELQKMKMIQRLEDNWEKEKERYIASLSWEQIREHTLKAAVKAWKSTIFGEIDRQLYEMCRTYFVFAFNGTRYDFPLLVGGLTSADDRYRLRCLTLTMMDDKETSTDGGNRSWCVYRNRQLYERTRNKIIEERGEMSSQATSSNSVEEEDADGSLPPLKSLELLVKALVSEGEARQRYGRTRLGISKMGRGISQFGLKGEFIFFRDAAKMISPGFSLSKLAETCGLQESKSVFPFEMLTDVDYLLTPKLPPVEDVGWESRLSGGKAPNVRDITRAHTIFQELGMRNVGQFLKYYLRLDVLLLQQAVLKVCRSFERQLHFHPLQVRKTTVASLSTHGAQLFLFKRKRPGLTCVNHAPLYNLLKSSCRGGLTQVSRTEALPPTSTTDGDRLYPRTTATAQQEGAGDDVNYNQRINAHWKNPSNNFEGWRTIRESIYDRTGECSHGSQRNGLEELLIQSNLVELGDLERVRQKRFGLPYAIPPSVPLDLCRLPQMEKFEPQYGDRLLYFDVASLYASAGKLTKTLHGK